MSPAATRPRTAGPSARGELRQRLVQTDRLVRVEVDRGLDDEPADEGEDDGAGRWPTTPTAVNAWSTVGLICSVFESSRNFFLIPLSAWSTATPSTTRPATITMYRPRGQPRTPPVAFSVLLELLLELEPMRILTAVIPSAV